MIMKKTTCQMLYQNVTSEIYLIVMAYHSSWSRRRNLVMHVRVDGPNLNTI
jgi:hypothetical protein